MEISNPYLFYLFIAFTDLGGRWIVWRVFTKKREESDGTLIFNI